LPFDYVVYGISLEANQPLPHLARGARHDVEAMLHVEFADEVPPNGTHLEYRDHRGVLEVTIGPGGRRVWMSLRGEDNPGTIGDATGVLVGPVLGGLLRLWGTVSLHGCVLDCGGEAVAVLGESGAGKSTLAAAMAQAGHSILSDDLAAITDPAPGDWWVASGYPRLRLSPDSVAFLRRERDRAPDAGRVAPGSDRRYVSLDADGRSGWSCRAGGMALAAIYELRRVSGCQAPDAVPLAGVERVATLVRHLKPAVVPLPPTVQADELRQLTRLAATIPIRRLLVPAGFERLADTCALLADGGREGTESVLA